MRPLQVHMIILLNQQQARPKPDRTGPDRTAMEHACTHTLAFSARNERDVKSIGRVAVRAE